MSSASKKRILLKISGEALCEKGGSGLDADELNRLATEITEASKSAEIGLVVGGGNFLRGAQIEPIGIDRCIADHMGMLATVMNALAVCSALQNAGAKCRVMSAIDVGPQVERFVATACRQRLSDGEIVVLAGGTGNPFFTTDTCASLRAVEIQADVLMKGTKVDGIYDSNPAENPAAKLYDRLSYEEVLTRRLQVMDATAIAMSREYSLPIQVFNLLKSGELARALAGEAVGTLVVPA